ncbi:MAG: hypothetical protein OXC03_08420 [Flavobacteriaceae bacterium]|nr:hypothetical protein [Flavobacteriaceae bacterium]
MSQCTNYLAIFLRRIPLHIKQTILAVFLLICWNCQKIQQQENKLLHYAPNDTFLILQIDDISKLDSALKSHDQLNILLSTKPEMESALQEIIPKDIKGQVVLFFNRILKDHVITSLVFDGEANRKLTFEIIEEIQYEDRNIEVINDNGKMYMTQLDQIKFITPSLLVIQSVIRNHKAKYSGINSSSFDTQSKQTVSKSLIQLLYKSDNSYLDKHIFPSIPLFPRIPIEWTQTSLAIEKDQISTQTTKIFDELSVNSLHIFKELPSIKMKTKKICPWDAEIYFAMGVPDYRKLEANYNTYLRRFNLELLEIDFSSWEYIKELAFFSFEGNMALVLKSSNKKRIDKKLFPTDQFEESVDKFSIYRVDIPKDMRTYFENLGFKSELRYVTLIDNFIVYGPTKKILETIIKNYLSGRTIENQLISYDLDDSNRPHSFVWIAKTNDLIEHWVKNQTENPDAFNSLPTVSTPFTQITGRVTDSELITQTILPKIDLKKTYNEHLTFEISQQNPVTSVLQWITHRETKKPMLIFQDSLSVLRIMDIAENKTQEILLDNYITSSFYEILDKNGAKNLVFRTIQDLFFVNLDTGELNKRNITSFNPTSSYLFEYKPVNQGPKYFYTIDDSTIQRFDQNNNKFPVDGYTPKGPLLHQPLVAQIDNKIYIVFKYATGDLEIVDYRTWEVLPFSTEIISSTKKAITHQNRFGFIDLSGNMVFFDNQGNREIRLLKLKPNSCVQSYKNQLIYTSGNSLFFEDKQIEIPKGDYLCPKIWDTPFGKITGLFDRANERFYLFNPKGNRIGGFPIKSSNQVELLYDKTSDTIKLVNLIDQYTIGIHELTDQEIH